MNNSQQITKHNPFNGEVLYSAETDSVMHIIQKIHTANKAYAEWKTSSLPERLVFLEKIEQLYISKKNELILSESLDQGLNLDFTEKANYAVGLKVIENLKTELKEKISESNSNFLFSSNGVVAVILSWNLSSRLFIEKVLSAWLAGNSVLVKISSEAVSTSLFWKQLLFEAQIPESTIQFVVTNEPESKKILVSHPGIKAVAATGDLKTVSDILKSQMTLIEKQFKKVQLQSGSKNPCIVLSEPSSEILQQVMESFFHGQGQLVWNSSRLFILEKYQAQWVEAIQNYLSGLSPSQSPQDNSLWGPIIKSSRRSMYDHYDAQARKDHGKIITTTTSINKNNFVRPLFTFDMSNCSELQQDQLHLPIFILSAVKYGFDVPKYSNVSYYGHSACIFSQGAVTDKMNHQLDVGLVSHNRWSIYDAGGLPAVKQSAFGLRSHQIFGEFNSNVKIIS